MKEEKTVGISALTIKIGKKEIEITPDDARDLYLALNKLYGEKPTRVEYIPTVPSLPYPWWNRPYYWSSSIGGVSLQAHANTNLQSLAGLSTDSSNTIDWNAIQSQLTIPKEESI